MAKTNNIQNALEVSAAAMDFNSILQWEIIVLVSEVLLEISRYHSNVQCVFYSLPHGIHYIKSGLFLVFGIGKMGQDIIFKFWCDNFVDNTREKGDKILLLNFDVTILSTIRENFVVKTRQFCRQNATILSSIQRYLKRDCTIAASWKHKMQKILSNNICVKPNAHC